MKVIKKAVAIISAFLFACVGLITSLVGAVLSPHRPQKMQTIEASAEETDTMDYDSLARLDSRFEFIDGATLHLGDGLTAESFFGKIRFGMMVTDPDVFVFEHEDDYAEFTFTIIRDGGTAQVPIYELKMYCVNSLLVVGHKKLQVENVNVSDISLPASALALSPDQSDGAIYHLTTSDMQDLVSKESLTQDEAGQLVLWDAADDIMSEDGFTLDYYSVHNFGKPFITSDNANYDYPILNIDIDVNSPYSSYFVTADCKLFDYEKTEKDEKVGKTGLFNLFNKRADVTYYKGDQSELKKTGDTYFKGGYYTMIKSPSRSVKGVLEKMQAAGDLEENLSGDSLTFANELLGTTEEKLVTVSYLEQIGSAPFARRVEKQVTVPTINDRIYYDDVSAALGSTLNCLGASIAGVFEKDSFGVYTANYLTSVRVEAKTTDGYYQDYFLDINQTFKEYYGGMMTSTAADGEKSNNPFDTSVYSYMLNGIKQQYPALAGYADDEIYGLWGYVVIPETTTINSIWTDIFKTPEDYTGNYKPFPMKGTLSVEAYNRLLSDYGYNWIERIWNTALTGVTNGFTLPCTHYLFYADPNYTETSISQTGQGVGDMDGATVNDLQEGVKELGIAIEETLSGENDLGRALGVILAVAAVLALVVGGVYVFVILPKKQNG